MESQKLKTQKLKCYVLGPKSQKFPTAENTRYTVSQYIGSFPVSNQTLPISFYSCLVAIASLEFYLQYNESNIS